VSCAAVACEPAKIDVMSSRVLILVKHALPVLQGAAPPREWVLSTAGDAQAEELADRLHEFQPFRLLSSPEAKALRTCEIIAATTGAAMKRVDGLEELDRGPAVIVSPEVYNDIVRETFARLDSAVLGNESAREAVARFTAALLPELSSGSENIVAVAHGTVISLFVAAHNAIDAFELWQNLECASFAVLELPSFRLMRVDTRPAHT